jgi:hypothetical protein
MFNENDLKLMVPKGFNGLPTDISKSGYHVP